MHTSLLPISAIVTSKLPLEVLLQQCNNTNKYDPPTQFGAWLHCLNEVNQGQNYQYTAMDFAKAIPQVWTAPQMDRDILIRGLSGILNSNGTPAFSTPAVYQAVNTQYPITVSITVDTTAMMAAHSNTAGGSYGNNSYIVATDDNNDPNQGSAEIKVYCNVDNQIRWTAKSKNGTDTVNLTAFVIGHDPGTINVFGTVNPVKQPDGSFEGTVKEIGTEVYHYNFTINGGSTTYWWDPYIQVNAKVS